MIIATPFLAAAADAKLEDAPQALRPVLTRPRSVIACRSRVQGRSRPVRLVPGRPVHLDAGWLARMDPAGGPVRVVTGA
jgi:hypothetical protein